jgi:hypothetical protein
MAYANHGVTGSVKSGSAVMNGVENPSWKTFYEFDSVTRDLLVPPA